MANSGGWKPFGLPPAPVLPVRVDPAGITGPTRGQARGPRWRQASRGLYVPSHLDPGAPEQRVAEAAALLHDDGAVTGWGSLLLAGAAYFDGLASDGRTPLPVPLANGHGQARKARGEVVWLQDGPDQERRLRYGVPCTGFERALFDDMRRAACLEDAVVAMDMTAAAELTSIRRMRAFAAARPGWLGVPLVRTALGLADENSWSPAESRLRFRWAALLPGVRLTTNQEVFDEQGRMLGTADLLDVVNGVVGEYDGAVHAGATQRSKDHAKDARFRDHGLEVCRVSGSELHDPAALQDRITRTYRRAAGPRPRRAWSVVPPPGWPVDRPLDDVLTLRDLTGGGQRGRRADR